MCFCHVLCVYLYYADVSVHAHKHSNDEGTCIWWLTLYVLAVHSKWWLLDGRTAGAVCDMKCCRGMKKCPLLKAHCWGGWLAFELTGKEWLLPVVWTQCCLVHYCASQSIQHRGQQCFWCNTQRHAPLHFPIRGIPVAKVDGFTETWNTTIWVLESELKANIDVSISPM